MDPVSVRSAAGRVLEELPLYHYQSLLLLLAFFREVLARSRDNGCNCLFQSVPSSFDCGLSVCRLG